MTQPSKPSESETLKQCSKCFCMKHIKEGDVCSRCLCLKEPSTQKESWEELFDERFTDNPVFWSELVSEWHQGDVDVKPFKKFISQAITADREDTIQLLEKEKASYPTSDNFRLDYSDGLDKAVNILKEK